jgi:hypothetical protein
MRMWKAAIAWSISRAAAVAPKPVRGKECTGIDYRHRNELNEQTGGQEPLTAETYEVISRPGLRAATGHA